MAAHFRLQPPPWHQQNLFSKLRRTEGKFLALSCGGIFMQQPRPRKSAITSSVPSGWPRAKFQTRVWHLYCRASKNFWDTLGHTRTQSSTSVSQSSSASCTGGPPAGIPSIFRLAPSTPRVTLRNGQWTPQRLPSQGFTLAQSNPHGSSSSSLFQPLDEDTGTL